MYKSFFLLMLLFTLPKLSVANLIGQESIRVDRVQKRKAVYVMPKKGLELYQKGRIYLKNQQWVAAEEKFKACLDIQPIFAPAWLGLTEIAFKKKNISLASEYLNKALLIEPNNFDVQLTVGRLHYLQGNFTKAEKALIKAASLKSDNFSVFVDLGDLYLYSLHNPAKAEKSYLKALALNSRLGGAYFGYAKTLMQQKKYKESERSFYKSAELNPEKHEPYLGLMELNLMQKQYGAALKNVDKAIEINPGLGYLYLKRGDIYVQAGLQDKAVASYQEATKKQVNLAEAYLKIGSVYQSENKYSKAEIAYQKALKNNPDLAIAYNNMAQLVIDQKQENRLNQALVWAKKANAIAPKSPAILDTLAWVSYLHGDKQKAINYLQEAISYSITHALPYYHLGVIYYENNQFIKAKSNLQHALKLNPEFNGSKKASFILDSL